jgi:hypothetical protein
MTIDLKVEEHIYKLFSIFKIFLYFLEIHCQDCQNNPLSTNPFSYLKCISIMFFRELSEDCFCFVEIFCIFRIDQCLV